LAVQSGIFYPENYQKEERNVPSSTAANGQTPRKKLLALFVFFLLLAVDLI
jgi:hypothetical protein